MPANAGPDIVLDGLTLLLDASSKVSYPGSGTNWFDISGKGYNSVISGSSTFNSEYGGSVVFDGSTVWVPTPRIPNTGTATVSVSFGVWAYPSSTAGNILAMSNSVPPGGWNMPPITVSSQKFRCRVYNNSYMDSLATISLNMWYYVVLVWKYSATASERGQFLYVNGVLQESETNITYSSSGADNYLYLGTNIPGVDNQGWFSGRIASLQVYGNKALTQEEVIKNFNVQRSKFRV